MKMTCPKCNESIKFTGTFGPRFGATLGGLAGTIAARGLRGGVIGAAVGGLIGYLYRENTWPCTCGRPSSAAPEASEAENTPATADEAPDTSA